MQEQQLNHGVANEPFAMPPQKIEEHMTDGKNDKTTDEARTGPEADKNREELEKQAERGIKAAKDDLTKDRV